MRQRHVSVTAPTRAPAAAVYRLLADGPSWPEWAGIDRLELEAPGSPPPEGVGAIRVLHRGRTTGRDEILELVPDRRLAYRTLSGVPVRDYVGEVDLTVESDGSTTIHWHSKFFPKVPGTGWLVERGIRRFLQGCARGLAEHAAEVSNGSGPEPAA
jgi:hypothetical protein